MIFSMMAGVSDIYCDWAPAPLTKPADREALMAKVRVQFRTVDGVLLRGDYFPVHVEMAPVVIMTPGVSNTIDLRISSERRSSRF
jgi:hypothetical protein